MMMVMTNKNDDEKAKMMRMIRTMIRILMMMIMTTITTMLTMTMMWMTVMMMTMMMMMMMMMMITMSGVMIYELSSVRKGTQQEKVLLKRIFPSNTGNTLSSFTGYFISSIISAVSFG